MKRNLLLIAGIILLAVIIRIPLLNIPFERDEGEYAYIAWRSGFHELPYRDWIDQKPPAIFWVYQAALSLPMTPICAVHVMGLLVSAATGVAFFFLASHFIRRFWAVVSAALLVLLSADPLVQGTAANTELFMLLPLVLSQVALMAAVSTAASGRHPILPSLLAGVFAGVAVAFKQVAIFNWPLLIFLYALFDTGPGRWRRTLSFTSCTIAGFSAVWGGIMWYFALQHGLKDLIYNVLTHNLEYVQAVPWAIRLKNCLQTLHSLSHSEALIWLLAVAGLAVPAITKKMKVFLFLSGWMLASFAGVSASGYYFPHYFQQMLPALVLAATLGADALESAGLWKTLPLGIRRAAIGAALGLLPVFVLYPFVFSYSPAEAVRQIYPGSVFAEMPELAGRLAQITRPEDRVFVFGAESELFFYAHRVSATRYIFLFPLYGPYSDAQTKQIETADEIVTHQPAAALYIPNGFFFSPGSEQLFTKFSEAYLHKNFHADTYLSLDQSNIGHFIPPDQLSAIPKDQRIAAVLMTRNSK